jgi:addiction module RelE/StbE family toxin
MSAPYRVVAHSRVRQDLKRLDRDLGAQILGVHFSAIEEQPYRGHALSHDLKGLWSYHFRYRGTDYRIVYEVLPEERVVLIVMVGAREGVYGALKRRIGRQRGSA